MIKVVFFDYNGTCTDLRGLDRSWVKTLYAKRYEGKDFQMMHRIIPDHYKSLVEAKPWDDTKAIAGLIPMTVCLTNNSLHMMNQLIFSNASVFDSIFTSDDARCYKPHHTFYEDACAAYRINPHEGLLVAAHTFDLRAAKAMGMQTCFIKREGEDVVKPHEDYDYIDYFVDNFYQLGLMLYESHEVG